MKQKIVILGAGPSGLVSAKYALEENFEPLILEKILKLEVFGTPKED